MTSLNIYSVSFRNTFFQGVCSSMDLSCYPWSDTYWVSIFHSFTGEILFWVPFTLLCTKVAVVNKTDWKKYQCPESLPFFVIVQLLSWVQLFVNPWTAALQASLSITNSWNLLRLMSIESVMPSNHLILCCPLFLLPSIFPIIGVFSDESALHSRWRKYWSFSISPFERTIQGWFLLGLIGLISSQPRGFSRVFTSTLILKHQFFPTQSSLWFNSHIYAWLLEKP